MVKIQHARHQGFTLFEVVAAIPVMAVFLFMAGQLFILCLHTFKAADLRAMRLADRQQMLRELRQDVAMARRVQLQSAHGLICNFGKKTGKNRLILWMVNANGTVTRGWLNGKVSPPPRYWPALLPALHFRKTINGNVELDWRVGQRHVRETLASPMTQWAAMTGGK
jgi:type II secretory pathway pseudopilin PulG